MVHYNKYVKDKWDSVLDIIDFYTSHQDEFRSIAGPGHWNDPDMVCTYCCHGYAHIIANNW